MIWSGRELKLLLRSAEQSHSRIRGPNLHAELRVRRQRGILVVVEVEDQRDERISARQAPAGDTEVADQVYGGFNRVLNDPVRPNLFHQRQILVCERRIWYSAERSATTRRDFQDEVATEVVALIHIRLIKVPDEVVDLFLCVNGVLFI